MLKDFSGDVYKLIQSTHWINLIEFMVDF
jgi:hypothetical protein